MSNVVDQVFGGGGDSGGSGTTTVVNQVPGMTDEEKALIAIQTQLAQRQLSNIDNLLPMQQELLKQSLAELQQQGALRTAMNKAMPPEMQADVLRQQLDLQKQQGGLTQQQFDLQKQELERSISMEKFQRETMGSQMDLQKQGIALTQQDFDLRRQELERAAADSGFNRDLQLGQFDLQRQGLELSRSEMEAALKLQPLQEEVARAQLEQLKNGGAATPAQIAAIRESADAAIAAGSGDIDVQTQRGIGLISDELANSRGLRLTDTPITREATLLARSGDDQKASLIKNVRSAEASARLNQPMAVSQLANATLANQQNLFGATRDFQTELRSRAAMNRASITGSMSSGIGLSSIQPGSLSRSVGAGGGVGEIARPGSFVAPALSAGIGLANIGGGGDALRALTSSRLASGTQTSQWARTPTLAEIGQLAGGIGGFMKGMG